MCVHWSYSKYLRRWELRYKRNLWRAPGFAFPNIRSKANLYIDSKLHGELDFFKGYLELEATEMNDANINSCFTFAWRLTEDRGLALRVFTRQIHLIGQFTNITACAATVASLVTRRSWPVLALVVSMPFLNNRINPRDFGDYFRGPDHEKYGISPQLSHQGDRAPC